MRKVIGGRKGAKDHERKKLGKKGGYEGVVVVEEI